MAFAGGLITIEQDLYKKILAVMLLFAIVRFVSFRNTALDDTKKHSVPLALLIGAVIGLISGMIGIGGGIILSPVILLLKWTDQKQTAAISAIFIFVNSLAGLAGQFTQGIQFNAHMFGYVLVAFAGGCFGAYFGALKFNQRVLKQVLAGVLLVASYKLLFTYA